MNILAFVVAQSLAVTYQQPLQCQATAIALNNPSTSATVTCPNTPPPTGCINPPIINSSTPGIANFSRWTGYQNVFFCSTGCGKSVDITSFNSVYGNWPGSYGLIATNQLPTNKYISMAFTIPANYFSSTALYGAYKIGETGAEATQGMTISTSCGDFSNPAVNASSTVLQGCWKNRVTSSSNLLQWTNTGSCQLKNGQTYYLNVINADITNAGVSAIPSTKTAQCSPYVCSVPVMNGPGNWK